MCVLLLGLWLVGMWTLRFPELFLGLLKGAAVVSSALQPGKEAQAPLSARAVTSCVDGFRLSFCTESVQSEDPTQSPEPKR